MSLGSALSVVFTGIAVVALALLLLMFCIQIMSKVMSVVQNSKKKPKVPTSQINNGSDQTSASVSNVIPEIEDGISDEVVAAITAAIAVVTEGTGTLVSIRRASNGRRVLSGRTGRNEWAMAGIRENTQPF